MSGLFEKRRMTGRCSLLLISHCVPDPLGHAERARAWQLLNLAAVAGRVDLACLQDAPVRLDQWRAIYARTDRLVIEPPPWPKRLARHWPVSALAPGHGVEFQTAWLESLIEPWRDRLSFDVVLCAHPSLWPAACQLSAKVHACDFHTPSGRCHDLAARVGPIRWRWQHRRMASRHHRMESPVARDCDLLLVGDRAYLEAYADHTAAARVLSPAVDLGYLDTEWAPHMTCDRPGRKGPVDILVYAPSTHAGPRRRAASLARFLQAELGRVVPRLRAKVTPGGGELQPLPRLFKADLVVIPLLEPSLTQWALLEAMALAKPIISTRSACALLGARPGVDALVADSPSDWALRCAAVMESSQLAESLAAHARQTAERLGHSEEKCANPLSTEIENRAAPRLHLARAA